MIKKSTKIIIAYKTLFLIVKVKIIIEGNDYTLFTRTSYGAYFLVSCALPAKSTLCGNTKGAHYFGDTHPD